MAAGHGLSLDSGSNDLGRQFVRTAKRLWSSFCLADSTGRTLTYGRALVAALLLARWLRRTTDDVQVGVLLPASVGGALANVGVTLAGRVAVNLNFTAGPEAVAQAITQCDIRCILTSRAFLSKAGIAPLDGMVYLEDVLGAMSRVSQAIVFLVALLLPWTLLCLCLGPRRSADNTATIVFSSGSTGVPKGVMLSHGNIVANIDAIQRVFEFSSTDVMLGVLPFFHSFGYTGTLWLPLLAGFGAAYHPNPTDAKTIGEMSEKYRATFLISTPTFCGAYIRKCRPEQFKHLRIAMVGAEKLREPTATAFRQKFGVELLEGYGCTEMAPVVAANAPERVEHGQRIGGVRPGSVGRPLPGVQARVVDLVTGDGPLIGREGLLHVRGPSLMLGYLREPERTREVMVDGWYITGDIALIDADGFLHITDRLSRFSKIAGEMVPHMKIEDSIVALVGEPYAAVVTAVPDDIKGERLVAFYTDPGLTPLQIWDRLSKSELPRLWIPKREDLRYIDSIPTLGTGKVDLRAVRQLAAARSLQPH